MAHLVSLRFAEAAQLYATAGGYAERFLKSSKEKAARLADHLKTMRGLRLIECDPVEATGYSSSNTTPATEPQTRSVPHAVGSLSQTNPEPLSSQDSDPSPPPRPHLPSLSLQDLPLWRADSVVLPGQQALLHIHTPHYVHMFDRLFATSGGPGQLFGHLHLPAGSRNLGAAEWALCAPGSRAPAVGVLMEVNRAVRLQDGKLMVLATALCRIQVRQCLSETPYSRARTELFHDDELLESYHAAGLTAVLGTDTGSSASPSISVAACAGTVPMSSMGPALGTPLPDHPAMQQLQAQVHGVDGGASTPAGMLLHTAAADAALHAAGVAAQAAATAATWRWLEYEAFTARAAAWPGRRPAEGTDPWDTRRLVSELVDHGVLSIVPFADGPVAGRWDLASLRDVAAADAVAAAAAAAAAGCVAVSGPDPPRFVAHEESDTTGAGPSDSGGREAAPGGASNSSSQRSAAAVLDVQEGDEGPGMSTGKDQAAAAEQQRPDSCLRPMDSPACAPPLATDRGLEPSPDAVPPKPSSSGRGEAEGSQPEGTSRRTFSAFGSAERGRGEEDRDEEKDEEADLTGHTTYDLVLLESQLWQELDSLAVLQARVNQQRLGLPLGLLQLRPSGALAAAQLAAAAPPSVACRRPETVATAAECAHGSEPEQPYTAEDPALDTPAAGDGGDCGSGAAGSDSATTVRESVNSTVADVTEDYSLAGRGRSGDTAEDSSEGAVQQQPQPVLPHGTVQPHVHPASEGLDVYCHPDYPLERRIMRLSYAAAGIFIE
ncbi:hypothetical protein VOLCADRAFT_86177, partial [Volvox carteri f. nagariensis]